MSRYAPRKVDNERRLHRFHLDDEQLIVMCQKSGNRETIDIVDAEVLQTLLDGEFVEVQWAVAEHFDG